MMSMARRRDRSVGSVTEVTRQTAHGPETGDMQRENVWQDV